MLSRSDKDKILYAIPGWAAYMETRHTCGPGPGPGKGRGLWRNPEARARTIVWLRANGRTVLSVAASRRVAMVPSDVVKVCWGVRGVYRTGTLPEAVRVEFGDLFTRPIRSSGEWRTPECLARLEVYLSASPCRSLGQASSSYPLDIGFVVAGLRSLRARDGVLPPELNQRFVSYWVARNATGGALRAASISIMDPARLQRYVQHRKNGGTVHAYSLASGTYRGLRKAAISGRVFSQQTADILGDLLPKGAKVEDHALSK